MEDKGVEASTNMQNDSSLLDCLFISGSRHDRHRIEIQFGFDGLAELNSPAFSYDVDFVLFVPRSLGLLESEELGSLRQDFQSYVRLHTNTSDPKDEGSAQRIKEQLESIKHSPKIDDIRVFAVEFEGFLRAFIKRTKKEIQKVSRGDDLLGQIKSEVESVASFIKEFRELLEKRGVFSKRAEDIPPNSIDHDLVLLNEYISHHYVQFLVGLEFSSRAVPKTEVLCERLVQLEAEEFSFRQNQHFLIEERAVPHSSENEDLYLRRISLLKKYFHKPLYVQITGEGLQRRLLVPVYALSAALAASLMILVQLYQIRSITERVGINSIAIIGLGILAYVAKDIFKELMRRYLYRTGNKWFPDYEKTLHVQKDGYAQVHFGSIKEYLRTLDPEKIPSQLKQARYSHFGGNLEESLYEDILHFKKRVELDLTKLDRNVEFPWGLREILRYRFDRLLPSMEDAFKNLYLVSKTGVGSSRQGHRVYHVYIACWIHQREAKKNPNDGMKPAFKAYRVTLDKSGFLACDSVKWDKKFGIPPIP